MDEVDDIDAEDINELEARLYAQIHHEAAEAIAEPSVSRATVQPEQTQNAASANRIVTATSVINRPGGASRVPDTRYWVNGMRTGQGAATTARQSTPTTATVAVAAATATVAKPATTVVAAVVESACPGNDNKAVQSAVTDAPIATAQEKTAPVNSGSEIVAEPLEQANTLTAATTTSPEPALTESSSNTSKQQNAKVQKPTTSKTAQRQKKQKKDIDNESVTADLRINPAAVCKSQKVKQNKKQQRKAQQTLQEHVPRTGPFMQQEIKLQKALLIAAKQQKSKNVRAKKQQQKQEQQCVETIVLESSEDSECDVVLIPSLPPPLITLDDSENEEEMSGAPQLEEENAMDATDVTMDSKSAISKSISVRNMAASNDVMGKRIESSQISSRCTSPCSVLSSDDFIGQTDRSRLLANNCMADDQDLALLTADVDSLMQTPQQVKKTTANMPSICAEDESSSDEVVCTAEFATPLATTSAAVKAAAEAESASKHQNKKNTQKDYRVDQAQFRALDVYESESDITDSVYSKGCAKATPVVLAAGSSSEDVDDIQRTPISQKMKRYVKRRTSSSNRGSETHNGDSTETESEMGDEAVTDGVGSTGVAYIMRGEAVEREGKKKRKRLQSVSAPRRASTGGKASSGHMSDTEFIATLNSLVHGLDKDNESDVESVASKEDTSNELLLQKNKNERDVVSPESVQIVENESPYVTEAVPEEAMLGLDNLFQTIDNLGHTGAKGTSSDGNTSDDEVEVVCPTTTKDNATPQELSTAQPRYHVIYSEANSENGGFGWNDEMRKFYNCSWRGEHFSLISLQNRMDRNKKLWKIYTEDRFPKSRPYSNLKCYNCCEFGHTRAKCKLPKKAPICYMCGESGHYEPRCPNTICLRCGNKTQVFTKSCNVCTFQNKLICPICKVRGHAINLCPDKWRRYHSTTLPNAYPESHMTFNRRKMCCICGGIGHFSEACRSAVRFSEYPVIVGQAKSHQKSYSDILFKGQLNGIAFNLLYKPSDIVQFHLAESTKAGDYYGRFLKAVGLGNLLRRKRISNVADKDNSEQPPKQARLLPAPDQPNQAPDQPSSAAKVSAIVTVDTELSVPDQVQEVSGSDSMTTTVEKHVECDEETNEDATAHSIVEENQTIEDVSVAESNRNEAVENQSNNFKAPTTSPTRATSNALQDKEALTMDSDSNYSFSEHFEMSNTAASNLTNNTANATNNTSTIDVTPSTSKSSVTVSGVREMEPLPDYIPLTDNSENNQLSFNDNIDEQAGISRRFVAADSDDETDNQSDSPLSDLPCEAKIYLTHFHSNYLLSPMGHEFLIEKSQATNVKARLDWTSVGHVLVLFGLVKNQDKFHNELLLKYRELSDHMNNKQLSSIKVPKRTDVLIRYLRDNIIQLQNDLGDVNELQHRITQLEKTHTKGNVKLAEKCRRLLNMILLGQAGLCGGSLHLDKLLLNLKTLINDHRAENVPNKLREEIDTHSKAIFTSYRHDNYPELIRAYNDLEPKSRIPKMNLDPMLLGQKRLNTSLTLEQKERLQQLQSTRQSKSGSQMVCNNDLVPNPLNNRNAQPVCRDGNSPPPPAPSMQQQSSFSTTTATTAKPFVREFSKGRNKSANSPNALNQMAALTHSKSRLNQSTPMKKQCIATNSSPFTNPQQRSTAATQVWETAPNWRNTCGTIFSGKPEHGKQRGNFNAGTNTNTNAGAGAGAGAPSKGPSSFWSRESLRYLDECIRLADSNAELLEKLRRIQRKSHEGALSYNDYRAVIKLHGAMIGN